MHMTESIRRMFNPSRLCKNRTGQDAVQKGSTNVAIQAGAQDHSTVGDPLG